ERHADAVGRRPGDDDAPLVAAADVDRFVSGHAMPAPRMTFGGGDDERPTERFSHHPQGSQARGVDAVVIGQKEVHFRKLTQKSMAANEAKGGEEILNFGFENAHST